MRTVPSLIAGVGVLALVAGACGGDPATGAVVLDEAPGCAEGEIVEGRSLRIATTVAPVTDIVDTLAAGSGASVTGIVPEGVDSHTFEPSPSDAAVLEQADVVLLNGLGLELPTRRLAAANVSQGAEICELGTTVLPESEYLFDASFPEEAGWPNPHLWTSTRWTSEYAELIASVLSTRDPANADVYAANLDAFLGRLDELELAIATALATVPEPNRLLLTYHDAYAYFADDVGWTVVGAVQPSSFGEPSPRDVARLIDQLEGLDVRAIFGSEVFPSPVLEQVAAETGARYVDDMRDDDLPGEPGDPDHSWFGLMRFNVSTMVEGLGGEASALQLR